MTYEQWRITYQSSEQAARSAFEELVAEKERVAYFIKRIGELSSQVVEALDERDELAAKLNEAKADHIHASKYYTKRIAELSNEVVDLKIEHEWQPIATAPKDGTLLLGFVPHSCIGYIGVFCWNKVLCEWQNNIDGGTDEPTHWMKLPLTPAGEVIE